MRRNLPGLAVASIMTVGVTGAVVRWLLHETKPGTVAPEGEVTNHAEAVDGFDRHWITFRPETARADAPILIVLHGTGGNGADLRADLGFRYDQLAKLHGFVVLYPDGWGGNWNEARRGGNFAAKSEAVDDTAFMRFLVDRTAGEVAPRAVWLTGHSSGGQMALRAALEASDLVDAFAASAASVPTPDNWQSGFTDSRADTVDALLIVGDRDPVNPFAGGRVGLFGVLGNRGRVLSAEASVRWLQQRNAAIGPGGRVEQRVVRGNGHHFIVPGRRGPRLFGPSASGIDLAEAVIEFVHNAG